MEVNLDLQTLPDEEVKDLNVKKRMLIDPKQTEQPSECP